MENLFIYLLVGLAVIFLVTVFETITNDFKYIVKDIRQAIKPVKISMNAILAANLIKKNNLTKVLTRVLTNKKTTTENQVKNMRAIRVKYLGATNNKGSRIKLIEQMYHDADTATLSYNYAIGNGTEQAIKYLQNKGNKHTR